MGVEKSPIPDLTQATLIRQWSPAVNQSAGSEEMADKIPARSTQGLRSLIWPDQAVLDLLKLRLAVRLKRHARKQRPIGG